MANNPFFDGNASVKKVSKLIMGFLGPKGNIKGKSLSRNAEGRKYPLGFTPPQDFYVNKEAKTFDYVTGDDGAGSINPGETGVYITRPKQIGRNGIDLTTGRHIEYGNAIVFVNDDGVPYIPDTGTLYKTLGNAAPINYSKNTDGYGSIAFTPETAYINPDRFDEKMTALGISSSGGYFDASIEYGNRIFNHPAFYFQSITADKLQHKYANYDNQKEYEKRRFLHLLDYFQDDGKNVDSLKADVQPVSFKYGILDAINRGEYIDPETGEPKKLYLGEGFFQQSSYDNEDPTYFGFDLQIIDGQSPILNGDMETFINVFGQYDEEIASRKNIYEIFKTQLAKFIKCESLDLNAQNLSNNPIPKSYYIKSITGLDKIVENFGADSDSKQFVDYQKDMIDLEFQEDVSQNIGYLTNLYKYLSYSRRRGKYVIPENLLRFDIRITVSDIRKFNRYVRDKNNPNKIWIFSDQISRYVYNLYECQFKFKGMPHGDVVKNSETPGTEPEDYKISFDYKFSTLDFQRFSGKIEGEASNGGFTGVMYKFDIDNSMALGTFSRQELSEKSDLDTAIFTPYNVENGRVYTTSEYNLKKSTINGQILEPSKGLEKVPTAFSQSNAPVYGDDAQEDESGIIAQKQAERKKIRRQRQLKARLSGVTKAFDQIGKALLNTAITQVNRAILSKAAILNKTLESIRNGIPGLERMSRPRNVYTKNDPLEDALLNSFRAGGPLASALLTSGYLAGKERLKQALDKSTAFVPTPKSGITGTTNVYNGGIRPR